MEMVLEQPNNNNNHKVVVVLVQDYSSNKIGFLNLKIQIKVKMDNFRKNKVAMGMVVMVLEQE